MRRWLLGAMLIAAPAFAQEGRLQHATGTFEVQITPQAEEPASDEGVATGRMGLHKTFSGALSGMAIGTMLTAGSPGEAMTYVAIDRFTGTLAGRRGGFVLAHRGTMGGGHPPALSVEITPGSGTGELTGITGTLSIDIRDRVHHYDLTYTLPAKD